MTWLVFIILALILYWVLDKGPREHKKVVLRRRQKISGKQITYTELASRRHNIHTALNMIKLNLVRTQSLDDERLSYIYAGGNYLKDRRMHLLAHRYGLVPESANYVGD